MRRAVYPMLLCGLALVAAGCGGRGITVEGKVVNGSNPYTMADGEGISINLAKEDGGGSAGATVQKDGTFKIAGADGAGLAPGKYKVTLTHYLPSKGGNAPAAPKPKNASDTWDVSASNTNFTLDMAKYGK